jgi:hypothetical protein
MGIEVLEKLPSEFSSLRKPPKSLWYVGDRSLLDRPKVSIVGLGMRSHAGVAGKVFETLAKYGTNIIMISTSEIKISCIIEEKFTELAVRVLHEAFGLDKDEREN